MKTKLVAISVSVAGLGLMGVAINAAPQSSKAKQAGASSQRETVAKPMTDKQRRKQEEKLRKELETPYKKWMNEDVGYIITDEERAVFKRLGTDDERQQFIEQFWLRRDPTPDTEENEYKEEHYRRIAYANDRFASGIPGWKTDRGRIYITFGPPDEIESHPSGGSYQRPFEEGGGQTSTYPFEKWRYRYIDGIGTDVNIEFVDTTMSGEYHMSMDPSEKDALLYVPNAGLTHDGRNGPGQQDRPLHSHRRYTPRRRQSAAAGQHERVRAAGAIRQAAKAARREVQGSGSGRQLQHPI